MSWASRRRFIILAIIGVVILAFVALVAFVTFYKAPSCADGVQNQGESGIDCGGPCQYLCTDAVHAPTVLFTKAISNNAGRTDVVASVENVNAGVAAKDVPYTVTLYGANNEFVQQVTGALDLPPASTVPVFVPGVSSGNRETVRAFLTIEPSAPKWYRLPGGARTLPVVTNTLLGGSGAAPRIDVTLSNSSITQISDVRVIVFVRDAKGGVIAASQTIVPTISAQERSTATFTWRGAFSGVPAAIEAVPVVPLP